MVGSYVKTLLLLSACALLKEGGAREGNKNHDDENQNLTFQVREGFYNTAFTQVYHRASFKKVRSLKRSP
jgi:hypothetical protein